MTLNLRDSTPGLRWWIFLVIFATFLDYTAATICPSCNRDFGSLGRHYWRCNGRMTSQAHPTNSGNTINSPIVIVIVISKLLKRYSKAKHSRAPAYSRALRRIKEGFPKGGQEKLRSEFQSTM